MPSRESVEHSANQVELTRLRQHAELLEAVELALIAATPDGVITHWNRYAEELYGWCAADVLGCAIVGVIGGATPLAGLAGVGEAMLAVRRDGRPWAGDLPVRDRSGRSFVARIRLTPLLDAAGVLSGVVSVSYDATQPRRDEAAALHLAALLASSDDAIVSWDLAGQVQSWNAGAERLYGYAAVDMVDQPVRRIFSGTSQVELDRLFIRMQHGEPVTGYETVQQCADGVLLHVSLTLALIAAEGGAIAGVSMIARDIAARKQLEDELAYQAFHDGLTDLPNRALFLDRLGRALARAERRRRAVVVLFIDLDNFKLINDSLGHTVGDQLLYLVARRLLDCVQPDDTVARLGGDEFTVLLEDVVDPGRALRDPFTLEQREVVVTTSIGVAFSGPADDQAEHLMRNADLAMYRAKSKGGSQHELFDPGMHQQTVRRLEIEHELRAAIRRGELRVYYQPEYTLTNGALFGVEALVRWAHPQRGLMLPDEFIPIAEETGLVVELGQWVLFEACRQARLWQDRLGLGAGFAIGVNLSARQFQQTQLAEQVARALAESGLPPRSLVLEMTESVVMDDADQAAHILAGLKQLGVQLAIDDFGIGYSSLARLKQFPVDFVKIDRAFISGVGGDPSDTALVAGMIAMARALRMQTVAEGVETAAQLAELRSLGCDYAQGYLFARALPVEMVAQELRRRDFKLELGSAAD